MSRTALMFTLLVACSGPSERAEPARPVPAMTARAPSDARVADAVIPELVDPDPWDAEHADIPALRVMREWARKMCACPDKLCAEHVQASMKQWTEDMARLAEDDDADERSGSVPPGGTSLQPSGSSPRPSLVERERAKVPADVMARMQRVGTIYGECMARAYQAR